MTIFIINKVSQNDIYKNFYWLGLGMVPNLIGAMSAITWHIYDNQIDLYWLVSLQGLFTLIGNSTLAIATFYIYRSSKFYG
tara:strand:+ start:368 stop:610 length:243 start_codon:yes stop_codon:yes gene_type:complete